MLQSLQEAAEAEQAQLEAVRPDAIVPWQPNPGPQTAAYISRADITGYGGSPGGGKSWLMLGLALTQHRRSLILRREGTQIRDLWDSAISLSDGLGARSNENLKVIRDLPGDRSLEFGGLKNTGDWKKYQGRAYDLHGFDEVTEFTEAQFRTIIAWNRTTIAGQRCRVVVTFNPPTTPEGEWILRYFAPWLSPEHPHPAEPGELRWYAMVDGEEVERADGTPFDHDGETIYPRSRTFFPAAVPDNPKLMSSGYIAALQALPEPLRSQLLYGDMTAGLQDDAWQVIPAAWVYAAEERYRALQDWPGGYRFVCVGADIGAGGDKTVFADRVIVEPPEDAPDMALPARQAILSLRRYDHKDTMLTVGLLAKQLRELGGHAIVDVIGIGAGVVDRLREQEYQVIGFNAGERSERRDRSGQLGYANQRSAAWWMLRELLDPANGEDIALPPDSMLRADLLAPRWHPNSSGRIQVESKEDIRKRIGRSTDDGDAVMMAWFFGLPGHTAMSADHSSRWTPGRVVAATEDGEREPTGNRRRAVVASRWRRS